MSCLIMYSDGSSRNDVIHRHIQQHRELQEIVYRWQGGSVLPFVYCLRRCESERILQVSDRQSSLLPQGDNVPARLHRINCYDCTHCSNLLLYLVHDPLL